MMQFEFKHWFSGDVLITVEAATKKEALETAVKQGAHLAGADLAGAHLQYADLQYAQLAGADLQPIRDDLWAVLCCVPAEVPALRAALVAGRVDGSSYIGPCACLVGTLAWAKGCDIHELPDLRPDAFRPSERWFRHIQPGDTPTTSVVVALTLTWIDTFLANMRQAFGGEPLPQLEQTDAQTTTEPQEA